MLLLEMNAIFTLGKRADLGAIHQCQLMNLMIMRI